MLLNVIFIFKFQQVEYSIAESFFQLFNKTFLHNFFLIIHNNCNDKKITAPFKGQGGKMRKALITGISAVAIAALAGVGAGTATYLGGQAAQVEAVDVVTSAAVLRQGSKGGEVKEVQRRLKNWGYYKGAVDGIYGPATVEAVKAFQRKNGLTADGIVGKSTYAALGMNESVKALEGSGSTSSSSSNYTNSDLYLLAKCIYAEARGESYTGQVAVGAVILNRVRSSAFPNTVAGVIYQQHAFTAVSDGQIN